MSKVSNRFAGISRLYGSSALEKLQASHVCVIGIGGVGSWAVEALARSAIGAITMVDYDTVAESNVNRQLHAMSSTLDRKKIHIMRDRILDINQQCKVNLIDDFINSENLRQIIEQGYDIVIDAIDSIKFKSDIIYCCKRNKIPVISTGGAGGLTDPTEVKVRDLSSTYNDPLAAKVRARLRDEYGYSRKRRTSFGVPCVFSSQHSVYPKADGSVSNAKPGIHGVHLDCSMGYGASSCVTSVFGFTAASRAIDKILGIKKKT